MPNPGSPESMMSNQQGMPGMSNKTLIGMMLVLVIMFAVMGFRQQIGSTLDVVLKVFAFPDKPLLSLVIVGTIMITIGTIVRGFMQNPIDMARSQQIQSDFNKEMRQARIENNLFKMKKLQEYQPQMMAASMEQSTSMMKTMPITMLVTIPLYAWIWFFIDPGSGSSYFATSAPVIDLPWCIDVNLTTKLFLNFPAWIFIYTMIALPIGQVENKLIRYYLMNKELKKLDSQVKSEAI